MMLVGNLIIPVLSQSAAKGAWPPLMAATAKDVEGGDYVGPQGFQEMKGSPGPAKVASQARDTDVSARLWAESERLTGVAFG